MVARDVERIPCDHAADDTLSLLRGVEILKETERERATLFWTNTLTRATLRCMDDSNQNVKERCVYVIGVAEKRLGMLQRSRFPNSFS